MKPFFQHLGSIFIGFALYCAMDGKADLFVTFFVLGVLTWFAPDAIPLSVREFFRRRKP